MVACPKCGAARGLLCTKTADGEPAVCAQREVEGRKWLSGPHGYKHAEAAPPAPWSWPPKKGDRIKYLPDGEVLTFTGLRNNGGGYDLLDGAGRCTGGLIESAANDGNWMRLPPEAAPTARVKCDHGDACPGHAPGDRPCNWEPSPEDAPPALCDECDQNDPLNDHGSHGSPEDAPPAPAADVPRGPGFGTRRLSEPCSWCEAMCSGRGREASLAVARWLAWKATGKAFDDMSDWGQDRYLEEARALLLADRDAAVSRARAEQLAMTLRRVDQSKPLRPLEHDTEYGKGWRHCYEQIRAQVASLSSTTETQTGGGR
jgi:hypothetical protein